MTKRERIAAYREAARAIAEREEEYSCYAIRRNVGANICDVDEPVSDAYAWMFAKPPHARVTAGDFLTQLLDFDVDAQAHRVLALLLAAEMVRTGDL